MQKQDNGKDLIVRSKCYTQKKEIPISNENRTNGKIEKVTKCWWIKVNKKPVRINALEDALFPYLMTVSYTVNGKKYKKTRYIGLREGLIGICGTVNVYYDKSKPSRCIIRLLGDEE